MLQTDINRLVKEWFDKNNHGYWINQIGGRKIRERVRQEKNTTEQRRAMGPKALMHENKF